MDNKETSGGTRFNGGKPGMWWAIPLAGLRLIAAVTMRGSEKYAPLDWACGQSFSTLIDSAGRHWLEVLTHGPLAKDRETGLLHLAHCAWNMLCLLHFIELGRDDLNDVDKWRGVTTAMKQEMEAGGYPPAMAPETETVEDLPFPVVVYEPIKGTDDPKHPASDGRTTCHDECEDCNIAEPFLTKMPIPAGYIAEAPGSPGFTCEYGWSKGRYDIPAVLCIKGGAGVRITWIADTPEALAWAIEHVST